MGWKKTKNGWEQTKGNDNKTLGGIPRETARNTNDKINEHRRWWNLTPLERAKELEDKDKQK